MYISKTKFYKIGLTATALETCRHFSSISFVFHANKIH